MLECSHTIIGGFLQDFSNPGNGLPSLEYELKKIVHAGFHRQFTEVNYYQWLIEPQDYARRCMRYGINRDTNELCKYHIAGYSFGGQTVVDILWSFYEMQIPVQKVLLIDPVRRNSRYPWGYLTALNRKAYFRIPPNVEEVEVVRQKRDTLIRGHDVIPSKGVKEYKETTLSIPHGVIDNSPVVRHILLNQAKKLHDMETPKLRDGGSYA